VRQENRAFDLAARCSGEIRCPPSSTATGKKRGGEGERGVFGVLGRERPRVKEEGREGDRGGRVGCASIIRGNCDGGEGVLMVVVVGGIGHACGVISSSRFFSLRLP